LPAKLFINLIATGRWRQQRCHAAQTNSNKLSKAHQARQFERVSIVVVSFIFLVFFLVLEARTGRYLGWRHVAQTYIIAPGPHFNTNGKAGQMFWELAQGCVPIKSNSLQGNRIHVLNGMISFSKEYLFLQEILCKQRSLYIVFNFLGPIGVRYFDRDSRNRDSIPIFNFNQILL